MHPMLGSRPARHLATVALVALVSLASACGSDAKSATTTAASAETAATSDIAAPVDTAAPVDAATSDIAAPVETVAPIDTTSPDDTAKPAQTAGDGVIVIDVDADSGTPIQQTVSLGDAVEINVVTATDQEFHLHGYDLELEGTAVTFEFTATKAGEFELESHATEAVILILTVEG